MDTIVAYIVALSIHYMIYKGLISALFFAAIFVDFFLLIINVIDAVKIMAKSYTDKMTAISAANNANPN